MKIYGRMDDSLWQLSQLFKVPLALLMDSNPHLSMNDCLHEKEIQIPGYRIQSYQMQKNESLEEIAKRFCVPLEALLLVNEIDDRKKGKWERDIQIPVRVTSPIVNGKQNYHYELMLKDLQTLEDIYPFMKKSIIGYSVQQRAIFEIEIGKGPKKVHMNASFHANEWITTAILMELLNQYLLSITNRSLLSGIETEQLYYSTTLSLVPMVNPDGVNLVINGLAREDDYWQLVHQLNQGKDDFSQWKANINGVDLNNQFPAKWEIEKRRKPQKPAPRDFPGHKPLTEPEAIAMYELTKNSHFDRVIAFHTQCKDIYWGFENQEPPYSEVIVKEFAKKSGYRPVKMIDSYAGYKDWFITEWKKPGFTVELGEGVNPLPITQFPSIFADSLPIFLASLYM